MSKIFTEKELEALEQRLGGSKKDPTGVYARRTKPKIKEMIEQWYPMMKKLQKLLK